MIKYKIGKCIDCSEKEKDTPLIAKRCSYHYKKNMALKSRPIKKVSSTQSKRDAKYYRIKKEWIKDHPYCEMKITAECRFYSSEVHHAKGKVGELYFDTKWFIAGCSPCHRYVTDHPAEAMKKGLMFERLKNEN